MESMLMEFCIYLEDTPVVYAIYFFNVIHYGLIGAV